MKKCWTYIFISIILLSAGHSSADESVYDAYKLYFDETEFNGGKLGELVVQDQIFFGTCFKKSDPFRGHSFALFLYAPMAPFKNHAYVVQDHFDGTLWDFRQTDAEDLEWVAKTHKERSASPIVQIESHWLWLSNSGYVRNYIKLIIENEGIKKILVRSDFTGSESIREINNFDSVGVLQHCQFEPI